MLLSLPPILLYYPSCYFPCHPCCLLNFTILISSRPCCSLIHHGAFLFIMLLSMSSMLLSYTPFCSPCLPFCFLFHHDILLVTLFTMMLSILSRLLSYSPCCSPRHSCCFLIHPRCSPSLPCCIFIHHIVLLVNHFAFLFIMLFSS
jgi:hypothetical protein